VAVAIAPGFSEGPIPHVRLFTEKILVSGNRTESGRDEELTLPVLSLSFDYGGTVIAASDERDRFFVAEGHGVVSVERDFDREGSARAELERLGAVELGCLDGYEESFGSPANYLVAVDGDVHTYCAFTAQAVPELRARGFNVDVDADYPYRVQESEAPWYVDVSPLEDRPDWFSCELGVELDGERVNLLEALLGLLDSVPDDESLSRLERRSIKFFAVPIDEQRYVRVPREMLWDFFEVLRELYSVRRTEPGTICRYQAASVEALAETIERHHEPLRRYGTNLRSSANEPAPRPVDVKEALGAAGLKATLRGYQELGVSWLQQLRAAGVGGILADDMGLGKTLQTIAHLCIEHARPDVTKPTLVVVPTSLIQNWRRELERFAPHLRVAIWHGNARHEQAQALEQANIIITSYSLLVRERERWEQRDYHYIILDEAQAIKNPRGGGGGGGGARPPAHRHDLSLTPRHTHHPPQTSPFD
jgi:hypothetical protein